MTQGEIANSRNIITNFCFHLKMDIYFVTILTLTADFSPRTRAGHAQQLLRQFDSDFYHVLKANIYYLYFALSLCTSWQLILTLRAYTFSFYLSCHISANTLSWCCHCCDGKYCRALSSVTYRHFLHRTYDTLCSPSHSHAYSQLAITSTTNMTAFITTESTNHNED